MSETPNTKKLTQEDFDNGARMGRYPVLVDIPMAVQGRESYDLNDRRQRLAKKLDEVFIEHCGISVTCSTFHYYAVDDDMVEGSEASCDHIVLGGIFENVKKADLEGYVAKVKDHLGSIFDGIREESLPKLPAGQAYVPTIKQLQDIQAHQAQITKDLKSAPAPTSTQPEFQKEEPKQDRAVEISNEFDDF